MFEESFGQVCSLLPPVTGALVLFGLSIVTFARDGKIQPANRLFGAICFLGGLINVNIALVAIVGSDDLALSVDRIVYLLFVFSPPLFVHFTHAYLNIRRPWVVNAGYLLGVLLLPFTQVDLFIAGHHLYPFGRIAQPGPLYYAFLFFAAVSIIYSVVLMARRLAAADSNQEKNRIRYMLAGLGSGALLILFNGLPVMGVPWYPLGNFSFIPALILAFGLLKYDLLDLRLVVGRGFHYLFLAAALTIMYMIILTFFNLFLLEWTGSNPLIISILLALLVVALYEPLKSFVIGLVERLYFRGRYNYRAMLKEVSERLTSMHRMNEIGSYLADSIYQNLGLSTVAIHVTDGDGRGFSVHQLRGSLKNLRANDFEALDQSLGKWFDHSGLPLSQGSLWSVALPDSAKRQLKGCLDRAGLVLVFQIPFRENLSGMLMLGEKRMGDLFTPEDMQLLSTMTNQAGLALANAYNYEKLEAVNRDLERRVRERTADLIQVIEEKERTQECLVRSESLATIGQLVAGAAHELNNPLAGALSLIESSVETLADSDAGGSERLEVIEDLSFSARELKRAGRIIKSLLSLSRQNSDLSEAVDIHQVLDDALRVLHSRYKERDLLIERDYDPGIQIMEGNFAQLGQAFINIINNAMQALPGKGGSIALTTALSGKDGAFRVQCRDNGCGIARERLQEVFRPFYTTKSPGEGTGLGLYIAHEILRRHGARIHMESEEGQGTAVTVQFEPSDMNTRGRSEA